MNQDASLKSEKDKIAIDSNIFRNLDFINFLRQNKGSLQIFLPTIVCLEVGYFYMRKGITWESFRKEVHKFNGIFLDWESIRIMKVLKYAVENKNTLPFRHHFRDFLIGTQCKILGINLVSYNKNHFKWLKPILVFNPEEYIIKMKIN